MKHKTILFFCFIKKSKNRPINLEFHGHERPVHKHVAKIKVNTYMFFSYTVLSLILLCVQHHCLMWEYSPLSRDNVH